MQAQDLGKVGWLQPPHQQEHGAGDLPGPRARRIRELDLGIWSFATQTQRKILSVKIPLSQHQGLAGPVHLMGSSKIFGKFCISVFEQGDVKELQGQRSENRNGKGFPNVLNIGEKRHFKNG